MRFRFADYVLDIARRELWRGSEPVALEPQVFDLLAHLIQSRERVVSKEDLLRSVWSGRIVSESTLTSRINAARKAVGDSGEAQRLIRTVPRRGFRFIGEVAEAGVAEPRPEPGPGYRPSIAVLAFENLSGDPEQEYFADGIADDIITELSRSQSLFVIARNSSFTYRGRSVDVRQIASELGVRYLLEGSVRRGTDRVRVSAQLIDAEANTHVWAERYDRNLVDVFTVQDEIAFAVTAAIQPAIADAELWRALRKPPENLGAWESYQQGLWHLAKNSTTENERVIEFFHRAISQDVAFVSAYVALVTAYYDSGMAYASRQLGEAVKMGGIWARKAAELDPDNADVQIALAGAAHFSGRRQEAWECASLALAINPHSFRANAAKGTALIFNGEPTEGRHFVRQALRLNPRDPRGGDRGTLIAISYYHESDYWRVIEAAKRTIARYPGYPATYRWLAAALGQLGRGKEARASLRNAMEIAPKSFDLHVRMCPPWYRQDDYDHMLDGLRKAGWNG